MAKPEWGLKRTCQSCGARFYDMLRQPPVCPVCNTEFVAEVIGRSRRSAPAKAAPVPAPVATPKPEEAADDIEDIEDIDDDDDDDSLIESTDDLDDSDDDDVAEVKEHMEVSDDKN